MNNLGQMVRTLVNERQPAGYRAVPWDGKNDLGQSLPSGVYFYRLSVEYMTLTNGHSVAGKVGNYQENALDKVMKNNYLSLIFFPF